MDMRPITHVLSSLSMLAPAVAAPARGLTLLAALAPAAGLTPLAAFALAAALTPPAVAQVGAGGDPSAEDPATHEHDLTRLAGRRAWRALDVDERHARRAAQEAALFEQARAATPDGWTLKESDACLFISQHDKGETKRKLAEFEDALEWLEEHFGELGDDLVIRPVVRYFADRQDYEAHAEARQQELMAHFGTGRSLRPRPHELVYLHVAEGRREWVFEGGFMDPYLWHFVEQKLAGLGPITSGFAVGAGRTWAPPWFSIGLDLAGLPGSSERWEPPQMPSIDIDMLRSAGQLHPARTLLGMTAADFDAAIDANDHAPRAQSRALFVHLLREGRKGPRDLADILPRYLRRSMELREQALVEALGPAASSTGDTGGPGDGGAGGPGDGGAGGPDNGGAGRGETGPAAHTPGNGALDLEAEERAVAAIDGEGPDGQARWLQALNAELFDWSDKDWQRFEKDFDQATR